MFYHNVWLGKSFLNTIVNEKVAVFNRTISNIINNYIRHENIVCNGRDPQWLRLPFKEKT